MAYNYAQAFVEYCRGTSLEEISHILAIPEETLKARSIQEGWTRLRNSLPQELPAVVPQGELQIAARAQLLQENRDENYKGWVTLRSHALKVINELANGELKITRRWHNRGQIVEKVCEPSIAEMTALANYYQIICNGSYLALGDRGATEGASSRGGTEGSAAHAPAITIVLPGAVSVPREQRAEILVESPPAVVAEKRVVDAEVVT